MNKLWLLETKLADKRIGQHKIYLSQENAEKAGMNQVKNRSIVQDYYVSQIRTSEELKNKLNKGSGNNE